MLNPILAIGLLNFALGIGWANVIGGRADDAFGVGKVPASRAIFRCILPAIFAALLAFTISESYAFAIYACFAVGVGSALWFPWGWSFDEINGTYDAGKYPRWVQKIGLSVYPLDTFISTNRERGILMKGIRGAFDIAIFALLAPFNPWIMLLWLPTFSMGLVYWICGKFSTQSPVAWAEFAYGCLRGALIGTAIILTQTSN